MALKDTSYAKGALKVALVCRHFHSIGGLEKTSQKIAMGFAQRGATVFLLTSEEGVTRSPHPSIHFVKVKTGKKVNFRKLDEFDHLCQKWIAANPTQIVFGMDRLRHQTHLRAGNGTHAAYLSHMKRATKWRGMFSPRLNPLHRKILEIERTSFQDPHLRLLFTNSFMVKKEVISHYGVAPEKVQVVHNGVEWGDMEVDFTTFLEKREGLFTKFGVDRFSYHFLFIGNGYKRKGLELLLRALSDLPVREFHLSVVGKDKNIQKFVALAKKLGIGSQVSFFGPQADVRPFYQYCDSLVIPSLYDPFANVTVEALAMGLFVVSSKSNGGHEVITEENGVIIEELFDPCSFKKALLTALSHRKSESSSQAIRHSVRHLDYPFPLRTLIEATLSTATL